VSNSAISAAARSAPPCAGSCGSGKLALHARDVFGMFKPARQCVGEVARLGLLLEELRDQFAAREQLGCEKCRTFTSPNRRNRKAVMAPIR
jgi:hypothetical protein